MSASLTHMIHDLLTEMSASGCEGGTVPMATLNSTGSLLCDSNGHQNGRSTCSNKTFLGDCNPSVSVDINSDRHSPFTFEGLDSAGTFEHLTKDSSSFQPRDSLLDSFVDQSFHMENINNGSHNFKSGEETSPDGMHRRSSLLSTSAMPTSDCGLAQPMSPPLDFSLFDPNDSSLSRCSQPVGPQDIEMPRSGGQNVSDNQTSGLTPFMSGLNFSSYRVRSKDARVDAATQGVADHSYGFQSEFDAPEPLSLPPRRSAREKPDHLHDGSPDALGTHNGGGESSHLNGVSASLAVSFDLLPQHHVDSQSYSTHQQQSADANTLRLDLIEALNEIKQTHDQLPVPAAFQSAHSQHRSDTPQHAPLYNSVVAGLTSSFSHGRTSEGNSMVGIRAHKVHHLSLSLDVPPDGITMATVVGPGPAPSPKRAYAAFASSVCTPATAITPISMSSFAFATPITATAIAKPVPSGERPQKKRRNWRWNRNSTLNTAPRVLMQPHTRYRWKLNHCLEQLRIMTCPAIRDATQYDILSAAISKLNSLRREIELLERGVANSGGDPGSSMSIKNEERLQQDSLTSESASGGYPLSSRDSDSEDEDMYGSTTHDLDKEGDEFGEQDTLTEGAPSDVDPVKMEPRMDDSSIEGAVNTASGSQAAPQADHTAPREQPAVKSEASDNIKPEPSTQLASSAAPFGLRPLPTTPSAKSISLDVAHSRWFSYSEPPRFILAPDLTFLDVSQSYAADFNLHRNDLRRMRITDLVPSENVAVTCQTFAQVMAEDDYVEVLGFKVVSRGVSLCDYVMWCSFSVDEATGARTVICVQGLQTNRTQP